MTDISPYTAIKTNLFLRIDTTDTVPSSIRVTDLTEKDVTDPFIIDGEEYFKTGLIMNISSTSYNLQPVPDSVTISLTALDNLANNFERMQGREVKIYRAFFDAVTGAQIGSTLLKYRGFIESYNLAEEWDVQTRTSSIILNISVNNILGRLEGKVTGRQTNPESMKTFYPTDLSFDRIPTIKGETWNFGINRS